jgi:hypothetical protein
MRVAICLSGQSRNWMGCRDTIMEKIIKPLNADVFFHSWTIKGEKVINEATGDYTPPPTPMDGDLREFFKPKVSIIELPDYDKFRKIHPQRYYNVLMAHYSIWRANELKKEYENMNSMKYDLVIRCRFDLEIHKFDIEDTLSNIQHTIYLPPNENMNMPFNEDMKRALELYGIKYMPNDQLAYGSSEGMDYYSKLWEIESNDITTYGNHGEGSYTDHLWNKNLSKFKADTNPNILMKIFR